MNKSKLEIVAQIIGELIIFIPLILFCVWINQIYPCVATMICLFSYKNLYKYDLKHFNKSYKCIILTYTVILFTVFIYCGISEFVLFMANQPLLIIIIVSIITYINSSIGEIQALSDLNSNALEKVKKENINLVAQSKYINENKNIFTLNENELREYCKHKGLTAREIDIVLGKIIHQIKGENLEDYMYKLPNNYKASLRTINRDISNIKKKLNIESI